MILDGNEEDDDADEFLVEEKPKDALELEMEPRPSSSLNATDVIQYSLLQNIWIFCLIISMSLCISNIIKHYWLQADALKAKGGEEHGALVQQILETQKELEEPKKKTLGGVEIVSIILDFKKYMRFSRVIENWICNHKYLKSFVCSRNVRMVWMS